MITFETAVHSHCGDERLGGSERIQTDELCVQAKRVDYWYTGNPESKNGYVKYATDVRGEGVISGGKLWIHV